MTYEILFCTEIDFNSSSPRDSSSVQSTTIITLTSIGVGVIVIGTISTALIIIVKMLLTRMKLREQNEVQLQEQSDVMTYEEIQPIQGENSGEIPTDKNSAYGHIHTTTLTLLPT